MRTSNKIALVLAVISLFAALNGYRVHGRHDWSPVSMPIDISKASSYEFDFIPKKNSGYELGLSTDRTLGFDVQNCRLGIETKGFTDCRNHVETLDLKWSLFTNEKFIAEGNSLGNSSGFWGERVGKILYRFDADKSKRHVVRIVVVIPDPTLSVANPMIEVSSSAMEYKDTFVIAGLSYYASIALLVIALVIWLMGFFVMWVKRKT
ncbi:hypothetical protein KUW04_01550 [Halomonas denitrificans]|nr:hypothetical protein [Halomonas denitrificans]